MSPDTPKSSNDLAVERTELAAQRNLMAADRTLMAWIRTALSMISFGFTIYKLLQGFQAGGQALPHPHTPRNIGLFLTGLGTACMVVGTIEYLGSFRDLRGHIPVRLWRPTLVIALIMSLFGSILFISIICKVL